MDTKTIATTFTFDNPEKMRIFVRRWSPAGAPKAAVLIAHGAAEHGERYARLAGALNASSYVVYAPDHRGHGKTAGTLDQAGWAGEDGWNGMLRDLKQLADTIRDEHPDLPLFLFGHSMGSLLTQRAIQLWGDELQGAILSGTSGVMLGLDQFLPLIQLAAQGEAATQPSMIFGQMVAALNEPFAPARTGFEWLSRDEAEVQKYADDPWCGFALSNQLVADFLSGVLEGWQPENEARIPKELPLLIFSGELDPTGGNTEGVKELARRYEALALREMELIFYPGGRHEMLNELNRDQVHQDIVRWLDQHLAE